MDDISQVVNSYYAVIGQKDEDIFELYRDNKRLKKQLDDVLTSEEERETDRRTLKLLVVTLQTELREKQILIEAQQEEAAAIRNALWSLRDALGMSSELDYPIADVIRASVNVHDECCNLRAKIKRLADSEMYTRSLHCATLFGAEQMSRAAIVNACDSAYASLTRLLRFTRKSVTEKQQLLEKHREEESAQKQSMDLMAKRVQVERSQQERLVEEWKGQVTCINERLLFLKRRLQQEQEEKGLLTEAACSRLDIMVERDADKDRMLLLAFRALSLHEKHLQESRREAFTLGKTLEKVKNDLSRTKALLQRKQKKPGLDGDKSGLNTSGKNNDKNGENTSYGVHDAFRALQMEHDALKVEWRKCVERERAVRQHTSAAISKLRVDRAYCEALAAESQERCAALERALERAQVDSKRHAKEMRQLQGRHDVLRNEAREHAERIKRVEEMNDTLRAENAASLARVHSLQEKLHEVEAALSSAECTARERVAALEQRLQSEKQLFLSELHEWKAALEEARGKLAATESERDREKMLRGMFVEQHRDEERILQKIMAEEHREVVGGLQEKIDVLEHACKRSAAVIAELREALHRARAEKEMA